MLGHILGNAGGNIGNGSIRHILCIIIVEIRTGVDLAADRGHRAVVAHHCHFHLTAVDELFHKDLLIVAAGEFQSGAQRFPVGCLGHTNGRTGTGGFYKHGISKAGLHMVQHMLHLMLQLAAANQDPCSLRNTGIVNDQLGQGLVHCHRRRGNMGAYIENTGHLQQALHSAVFTVLAVQDGENHIHQLTDHIVAFKYQQALTSDGRDGCPAVLGVFLPLAAGKCGIILSAIIDPVALLGNANRQDIVLLGIHIIQNRFCRTQGNIMFRADTAKQNANIQLFQTKRLISNYLNSASPARKISPAPTVRITSPSRAISRR